MLGSGAERCRDSGSGVANGPLSKRETSPVRLSSSLMMLTRGHSVSVRDSHALPGCIWVKGNVTGVTLS
jgi:hypothetical protein